VTGYFGIVPGSLLAAIGRGYTDLCAALLAVGLGADELQIWKEVDGIFTADPRKVPTARLLSSITPDEAAELTFFGSEVGLSLVCPDSRLYILLFVSRLSGHVSL
jgi:aspartate kinase